MWLSDFESIVDLDLLGLSLREVENLLPQCYSAYLAAKETDYIPAGDGEGEGTPVCTGCPRKERVNRRSAICITK